MNLTILSQIIKENPYNNLYFKIESIFDKLDNEINPNVALSVLYAVCSQFEGDETKLLKYLSDYFRNFFYLFDY